MQIIMLMLVVACGQPSSSVDGTLKKSYAMLEKHQYSLGIVFSPEMRAHVLVKCAVDSLHTHTDTRKNTHLAPMKIYTRPLNVYLQT